MFGNLSPQTPHQTHQDATYCVEIENTAWGRGTALKFSDLTWRLREENNGKRVVVAATFY